MSRIKQEPRIKRERKEEEEEDQEEQKYSSKSNNRKNVKPLRYVHSPVPNRRKAYPVIKVGGPRYNELYDENEEYFRTAETFPEGTIPGRRPFMKQEEEKETPSEARRDFAGSSNYRRYIKEGVKKEDYCGSAGGSAPTSFPVNSPGRFRSALAYARNAPNPDGIRECAIEKAFAKGWIAGDEKEGRLMAYGIRRPNQAVRAAERYLESLVTEGVIDRDTQSDRLEALYVLRDNLEEVGEEDVEERRALRLEYERAIRNLTPEITRPNLRGSSRRKGSSNKKNRNSGVRRRKSSGNRK